MIICRTNNELTDCLRNEARECAVESDPIVTEVLATYIETCKEGTEMNKCKCIMRTVFCFVSTLAHFLLDTGSAKNKFSTLDYTRAPSLDLNVLKFVLNSYVFWDVVSILFIECLELEKLINCEYYILL